MALNESVCKDVHWLNGMHTDILSNGTICLNDLESLLHSDGDALVRMEGLVRKGKARDGQVGAREVIFTEKGSNGTSVCARFSSL
ncbi:hypothetical protein Tco_0359783 [Tanacetum coccineum]